MQIRNKTADKTNPWGTPGIGNAWEETPSRTTLIERFCGKLPNQFVNVAPIPNELRLESSPYTTICQQLSHNIWRNCLEFPNAEND